MVMVVLDPRVSEARHDDRTHGQTGRQAGRTEGGTEGGTHLCAVVAGHVDVADLARAEVFFCWGVVRMEERSRPGRQEGRSVAAAKCVRYEEAAAAQPPNSGLRVRWLLLFCSPICPMHARSLAWSLVHSNRSSTSPFPSPHARAPPRSLAPSLASRIRIRGQVRAGISTPTPTRTRLDSTWACRSLPLSSNTTRAGTPHGLCTLIPRPLTSPVFFFPHHNRCIGRSTV